MESPQITLRTLLTLEECARAEAAAAERLRCFSQALGDPALKTVCERAWQMHRRHFDLLLSHILPRKK